MPNSKVDVLKSSCWCNQQSGEAPLPAPGADVTWSQDSQPMSPPLSSEPEKHVSWSTGSLSVSEGPVSHVTWRRVSRQINIIQGWQQLSISTHGGYLLNIVSGESVWTEWRTSEPWTTTETAAMSPMPLRCQVCDDQAKSWALIVKLLGLGIEMGWEIEPHSQEMTI